MSRLARTGVYVALLLVGLSLTPARFLHISLPIAAIGLLAFFVVQVRSTKNETDLAFAWVALWAVVAVLGAPLVTFWHALGDLAVDLAVGVL
ncbi:hypothetical protein ABZ923_40085 [Streptomyces sp. NPDC046881]|uniref:hypothetical protein n=1 Tax=Streptomyces sp. NPDC046881 TaxID=3155374 RepID=UPI0033C79A1E